MEGRLAQPRTAASESPRSLGKFLDLGYSDSDSDIDEPTTAPVDPVIKEEPRPTSPRTTSPKRPAQTASGFHHDSSESQPSGPQVSPVEQVDRVETTPNLLRNTSPEYPPRLGDAINHSSRKSSMAGPEPDSAERRRRVMFDLEEEEEATEDSPQTENGVGYGFANTYVTEPYAPPAARTEPKEEDPSPIRMVTARMSVQSPALTSLAATDARPAQSRQMTDPSSPTPARAPTPSARILTTNSATQTVPTSSTNGSPQPAQALDDMVYRIPPQDGLSDMHYFFLLAKLRGRQCTLQEWQYYAEQVQLAEFGVPIIFSTGPAGGAESGEEVKIEKEEEEIAMAKAGRPATVENAEEEDEIC
jgi:hypothetical protein